LAHEVNGCLPFELQENYGDAATIMVLLSGYHSSEVYTIYAAFKYCYTIFCDLMDIGAEKR
jgi:hypothetical protein